MRKKHLTAGAIIMLVLMTAVTTYVITYYTAAEFYNAKFGDLHAMELRYQKFKEVSQVVDKNFIAEYDFDAAMDGAMAGFVAGLGDKWSGYYTAEQTQALMESEENAYVGIGVTIAGEGEEEPFLITKVSSGGPADEAGILPFDIITHVDGVAVDDIGSQAEVINKVRGLEGTSVRLTVSRLSETLSVDIKRATVYNEQVEARMLEGDIGYISVSGFENNVDDEFKQKLNGLVADGARGIIFDVRMNPGGKVNIMVNMLDLLLPECTVISMVDNQGELIHYSSDAARLEMPMAVIINEYSISAAEFFAAALQEYGVAQVVGMQTSGKGYAQVLYPLSDGSSINLSVMRYYTPKGNSLVDVGVTPDHEVDLSDEDFYNFYSLEDQDDDQLQKAIQVVADQLPELPEADTEPGDSDGEPETTAAG